MTSPSLSSASAYLNNLLLSRGLLQDGRPIDFAQPTENGSTDIHMSRIINLVHDLVLRRDREAEQREHLVSNLRLLRAEEGQRVLDLQRMQEKNADLTRELTTAQTQERTLKTSAKKADTECKELKEQLLKMKSTLDQVRAKCVSDIRKRDVELEKLKGHLTSMQRGKRDASGMKVNVINPQLFNIKSNGSTQDVNTTEWSLEKETNDFLAALVNETSTENVSLRNIVIETMDVLKDLTGFDLEGGDQAEDNPIGVPGQYRSSRQSACDADAIVACETLAAQMNAILEHCRTILKDPSFVSIEEVQIREEEIIKLRIGWEKMANRWKEAVTMMDAWRKRMLEGKGAVDVNELSHLEFGRSVAVMPNGEPVLGQRDELSAILFDHSRISAADEHSEESESRSGVLEPPIAHFTDACEEEESDLEIPRDSSPKRFAESPARRGIKLSKPSRTLDEVSGNARHDTSETAQSCHSADSGIGSLDGAADEIENLPPKITSRIPQSRTTKGRPPLSVPEKLAAVEAEARMAQESRTADRSKKRKAILKASGKTGRRRSTLSPDELATLMKAR